MQNMTSDIKAPHWIRMAFTDVVRSRYYEVMPSDEVDRILEKNMCITLGGQLDYTNPGTGAPTPQEVGKTLEVDGLFYCNILDFQIYFPYYLHIKQVKIRCKLVNTKTGAVVWEKEAEKDNTSTYWIAGMTFLELFLYKNAMLGNANPMPAETNAVVKQMQTTIPPGPGPKPLFPTPIRP